MLVSTHETKGSIDPTNFDYDGFLKFATNIYVLCDILKSITSKDQMASAFTSLHTIVDEKKNFA